MADRTQPYQAQGPAHQAPPLPQGGLGPLAGAQIPGRIGDMPIGRQEQAQGDFGYRVGITARGIADLDAARGGGGDVDGIRTGSGPDDEPQGREGRQESPGNLGGADYQDFGGGGGGGEGAWGQAPALVYRKTQILQSAHGASVQLIGNQDAHGGPPITLPSGSV